MKKQSFKKFIEKGARGSLEKQNKVFFDKKNIDLFKKVQKMAKF